MLYPIMPIPQSQYLAGMSRFNPMSQQADNALAEKVSHWQASSKQISELAREHGYEFTPEEFEAALPKHSPEPDASYDCDLTEEELDMVAGTGWGGYWTWNPQTRQWTWTWVWYNDTSSGYSVS